jgi:hypothetical protein
MIYITLLLISTIAIEGAATLLTESFIFKEWRRFLENKNEYLSYMSTCHQCTSQQLAIILSVFLPNPWLPPLIGQIIIALLIGRLAYLLHLLTEGIPPITIVLNYIPLQGMVDED